MAATAMPPEFTDKYIKPEYQPQVYSDYRSEMAAGEREQNDVRGIVTNSLALHSSRPTLIHFSPRLPSRKETHRMAPRILIVEDDFDTRYVLSLILKGEGYEVITAADGECAVGVAFEQRPDLIITDVRMPRLSGIELMRKIRMKPETASIPVLVITAYGETPLKLAMEAGASACMRKPIVVDELLPMLRRLLA